ncbi:glycosyltransferase [Opitutaceae bacterium TAV5]|nr:glycosyltransferase [Opitutaceae bacterium TAV5]
MHLLQYRLRVKFMAKGRVGSGADVWLRQFPGRSGSWGRCDFSFDPDERRYDWLVVYDDLPAIAHERHSVRSEPLACHPRNTLLVTTEPASVKCYGDDFLNQFGHVLTSQEPWVIRHPGAIFSQPGLRWFYGAGKTAIRDFDAIASSGAPRKTADLATVCSDKRQRHTLHRARYEFVQTLRGLLPHMDVFGHGVRFIEDKAEAIDPYRYHLAVENHRACHHWTEKLADPFLGLSMPFYYGCPNAADYFPEESFVTIDIRNPAGAAEIIRRTLRDNLHSRHLSALLEARRRVLCEYNLFSVVSRLAESLHEGSVRTRSQVYIRSRHALRCGNPWKIARFAFEKLAIRRALRQARGAG